MKNNNWNGVGFPELGEIVDVKTTSLRPLGKRLLIKYKGKTITILENALGEEVFYNNKLIVFKPILCSKQLDIEVATLELSKLFGDCLTDVEAAELMIANNWRKIKPLPADWYADCLNGDMTLNQYLIENLYCIGEYQ